MDTEQILTPDRDAIDRMTHHTTPGPDGPPFLAWARASDGAREVLHTLTKELMRTGKAPPSLNASLAVFPPKWRHPDDLPYGACNRKVAQTCPFTLKNADAKTIAAAIHCTTRDGIERATPRMQSGILPGRAAYEQAIALETAARIAAARDMDAELTNRQ